MADDQWLMTGPIADLLGFPGHRSSTIPRRRAGPRETSEPRFSMISRNDLYPPASSADRASSTPLEFILSDAHVRSAGWTSSEDAGRTRGIVCAVARPAR